MQLGFPLIKSWQLLRTSPNWRAEAKSHSKSSEIVVEHGRIRAVCQARQQRLDRPPARDLVREVNPGAAGCDGGAVKCPPFAPWLTPLGVLYELACARRCQSCDKSDDKQRKGDGEKKYQTLSAIHILSKNLGFRETREDSSLLKKGSISSVFGRSGGRDETRERDLGSERPQKGCRNTSWRALLIRCRCRGT